MTARNDFDDSDDDLFDADLCALLDSTVADLSALKHQQDVEQNAALPSQGIVKRNENKDSTHHGLKWNAASSLSRAVAQKRMNSGLPPVSGSNVPLPMIQDQQRENRHIMGKIEHPHKAQMSELQRQIDLYKQQLIFKQQEIEELKRQSSKLNQVSDFDGRVGPKRFQSPSSISIQGDKGSPLLTSSKRGLEQPTTPSMDKSGSYGDGSMPCIVPVRRVSLGSQLSIVDVFDKLDRYVDGVRRYRRMRSSLFSVEMQQDDVPNAVLVNLESALLLNKHANLKDIFTMLLSCITHVIVEDCRHMMEMHQSCSCIASKICSRMDHEVSVSTHRSSIANRGDEKVRKNLQHCMEEFPRFVSVLFAILNELVMDTAMGSRMIELVQDPVDPLDMIKPAEKNIIQNIICILDTLMSLETYSSSSVEKAVSSIVQFMFLGIRLRTEISKGIFSPILKSRQIQQVLLKYPSVRKKALMLIMIILEDNDILAAMEHAASQDLQVSPSKKMTVNQSRTPSRLGSSTHRRHSITQKRIDDSSRLLYEVGSPSWASKLVQTILLCLSIDHNVAERDSWDTLRMCFAFFAYLMNKFSEALLACVLMPEKLEAYDVDDMFRPSSPPDHLKIAKTIPLCLVDIADKASGAGDRSMPPHVSILHPVSPADIGSEKAYFTTLRIVEESLVLLRDFVVHSRFGKTTVKLLAHDNNVVLCVFEKLARYPDSSSRKGTMARQCPLAAWVKRVQPKNDGTGNQHGLDSGPAIEDVVHISRMLKCAVLKHLDSDK